MPHALVVFKGLERGGAEEYVLRLTRHLVQRGWRVTAAFPRHPATEGLRAELAAAGARPVALHDGLPARPGAVAAVAALLAEGLSAVRVRLRARPTAVLVSMPHPEAAPGVLLGLAAGGPAARVLFHLVRDDVTVSGPRRLLYRLARSRQRWYAVSRRTAANAERAFGAPPGSVGVLPNGVDVDALTAQARRSRTGARDALRSTLDVPSGGTLVVTVARLSPQKDPQTLVDAAAAAVRAGSRATFAWVGDGPLRAQTAERAEAAGLAGRLHLVGRTTDVSGYLAAADVFVLPSRVEGMAFAALEAFAHGLPCVLTEPAGIDGALDGEHVLQVPAGDPAAIAAAVRRLEDDPALRERLGLGAAALVRRYTLTDAVQGMESALLGQPAGGSPP